MYAKGMMTGDIEAHIQDIYGLSVSDTTVSRITDKILPVAKEWQQRPLESIYMNGFAALDIPPCRRYVVVKATAGFAVCRLILQQFAFLMHKQHPQTAYRKDAVLIGPIFENCDKIALVLQLSGLYTKFGKDPDACFGNPEE